MVGPLTPETLESLHLGPLLPYGIGQVPPLTVKRMTVTMRIDVIAARLGFVRATTLRGLSDIERREALARRQLNDYDRMIGHAVVVNNRLRDELQRFTRHFPLACLNDVRPECPEREAAAWNL